MNYIESVLWFVLFYKYNEMQFIVVNNDAFVYLSKCTSAVAVASSLEFRWMMSSILYAHVRISACRGCEPVA